MIRASLDRKNFEVYPFFGILVLLFGLLWNSCLHGGDFKVFYLAGERFLHHVPLYQVTDGWSPFKYHPSWAVFFSLWSLLPLTLSVLLFNFINILFWTDAARSWARLLNYKFTPASLFLLLVLSLNALSAETAYGQINGFLFWGSTRIFLWMEEASPKPLRSGVLLAVLISLKLNFGILAFYLFSKHRRAPLGLALGGLGLHVLALLAFRETPCRELYRSWLDLLLTQSREQFNTFEVQSMLRACYIFFGEPLAKTAWAALLGAFVLGGVFLDRVYFRNETDSAKRKALAGAYWLTVIFLFSPLAWWYQVLYLFPCAFLLLKIFPQKPWQPLIRACLLSFAFISFNTLGREGIFKFKFYMGYFAASLVLFAILVAALVKIRPQTIQAGDRMGISFN